MPEIHATTATATNPSPGKRDSKYIFGAASGEDDLLDIFEFRYRVYAEKMGRRDISDADHHKKIIQDGLDDAGCHFTIKHQDRLVGSVRGHLIRNFAPDHPFRKKSLEQYKLAPFVAAFPGGIGFSSRLIIDPDHRQGPVLNRLLVHSFEAGLKNGVHFGFVQCSPSLVELYERLGYRRYTDNLVDPVFGYKIPMVLVLRDLDYLRSIRSPLARILERSALGASAHPSVAWFNKTLFPQSRKRTFQPDALEKLNAPILQGLSRDDLSRFGKEGTILQARKGDTVIQQNGYGGSMFVILKGEAKATVKGSDDAIADFRPGDVFGEISSVTGTRRNAGVTITQDSELFVFTRGHLDRMMKTAPELAAKVLLNISRILGGRLIAATRHAYAGQ